MKKNFYKLISEVIFTIFVFITLHCMPLKPLPMLLLFTSVPLFDGWIEYWMRTNREQLSQRSYKIFSGIFYFTITCFFVMILAFWISPLGYWPPFLRIYGFGFVLISVSLKITLAFVLFLQFFLSKIRFTIKIAAFKRWFQIGLSAVSIVFALSIYGMFYEVFDLRVHQLEVKDKTIPKAFDGYKIVQFSDLHIGTQFSTSYIQKIVDSIQAQKPDLVVFTGDMINFHTGEFEKYHALFSEIRTTDGVYAILGNHDYGGYLKWKSAQDSLKNLDLLLKLYTKLEWKVLQNAFMYLHRGNDSIVLAGVEHYTGKKAKRRNNLADTKSALSGISPEQFMVLLSHNPQHFEEELSPFYPYVNLTLSGHSHGGQVVAGVGEWKISPAQFSMRYWRGFHHIGTQYLNVNTGCGFNSPPYRIGVPPSISVITLRRI